ncbi:MAG: hypothetical protein AAFU57_17890 [Bacteroidota bacterium]
MKQFVTLVLLAGTLFVHGQDRKHDKHRGAFHNMTAEQVATLHTKKMTLALDLSQIQQKEVMDITLEEVMRRKAKRKEIEEQKENGTRTKPSSDERFEMLNERLEQKIAHHQKMKEVLNEEQYKTWKQLELRKAMHGKKKMQKEGRRG